jgi:hypothetical protein
MTIVPMLLGIRLRLVIVAPFSFAFFFPWGHTACLLIERV